jgi:ABC transport system ATP-binding/permease protein
MALGGHLAFVGEPDAALERCGVDHYDELYSAAQPTQDLALDGDAPVDPRRAGGLSETRRAPSDRSFARQLTVLTGRYLRTFARDRRTVLVLLGQVPVIALLIAFLFPAGVLDPNAEPTKSAQFAFLLVTASLWIGLINSCREIVNERSIILREFTVGSRIGAYLASKAAVLFSLAAVQTAVLLTVATFVQPLHEPAESYVELYAVESMQPAIRALSDLVVARWSFAGAGSSIEMNARLASDKGAAAGYGHAFFSLDPVIATMAILVFVAAALAASGALLARRTAV